MPIKPLRDPLRIFRHAMFFDGVDDYVSVSFPYTFTAITIIAWVNYPFSRYGSTCIRGAGTILSRGWDIGVDYNTFYWTLTDGSGIANLTSDFILYINRWAMIWGRYDGSIASMGINDRQTNSRTFKADLNQGIDNPMFIMCRMPPVAPWRGYKRGYLASIYIYSRALSDSEILWNYQYPDNPVRKGLVLWFYADPAYIKDIDNDGVLEWIDLSGYGNHGKIYGATLVQLIRSPVR